MRLRAPAACWLFIAGCATARPDFERRFDTSAATGRAHDAWMTLLETRYGCDTVLVNAHGTPARTLVWLSASGRDPNLRPGMTPCDVASLVAPEVVRGWNAERGWREEWVYRTKGGGPLSSVLLEGPGPMALRVTVTAR
jgi:hypothetical protein